MTKFIPDNELDDCDDYGVGKNGPSVATMRRRAKHMFRTSVLVKRVDGGFMAFETDADYQIWRNQK